MTRYVVLTEFAPPDHGGIQASVDPIIEALGQDVTVIAPQSAAANDRRIVRSLFSGTTWPRWWWLVSWLRLAKKEGLETVIFGHFSGAVLAGWIAKNIFGLPYVILVHGNDLLSEQHRWFTRLFISPVLRQAMFVGVNSSFVENIVSNYGVPHLRIVRSHPFVLASNIPDTVEHKTGSRLITVSRLVARKNIDGLLQAVVEVKKEYPDIHLDIVGDGPERQQLVALTKTLGIEKEVTFHGTVVEATKWQLLRVSNIFIMCPIVREDGVDVEGLGLVYLEASSCGLPIVASDTGGVRDAVQDGITGLLVDSTSTLAMAGVITQLLKDQAMAEKFGWAGRGRVIQEFTDAIRIPRFLTMLGGIPKAVQPLVSIIIPAYNAADTISATLASVKKQSWNNLEVILVDDGSTDDLPSVLQPYATTIKLIRQQNSGAPSARNAGFDQSRGEYVIFLDADIVLEPTAIEKMIVALTTHPDVDFVYSDFYFGWKKFHLFDYSSQKLRQQNYIHTTSLMRREKFPRFDRSLKRFQDWDLWLTMDKRGCRGAWIPETLFRVTPRTAGRGMSTWVPSFMYKLPGIGQGRGNDAIASYRQAEIIIRAKHRL